MQAATVREFRASDTAVVVDLWSRCGLLRPWNDPLKDIARKAEVQPDLFLVAVQGGVVGSVMGGYDGHRGWMYYLAVHPEHRRVGIGEMLVAAVESRLLARGVPKVNLMVRGTNTRVAAFYEELGYTRDDVVVLGKRLIADDPAAGIGGA